jgi:hypothetical protein
MREASDVVASGGCASSASQPLAPNLRNLPNGHIQGFGFALMLALQAAQAERHDRYSQLGRGGNVAALLVERDVHDEPIVMHGAHPGRCSISAARAVVRWFDAPRIGAL